MLCLAQGCYSHLLAPDYGVNRFLFSLETHVTLSSPHLLIWMLKMVCGTRVGTRVTEVLISTVTSLTKTVCDVHWGNMHWWDIQWNSRDTHFLFVLHKKKESLWFKTVIQFYLLFTQIWRPWSQEFEKGTWFYICEVRARVSNLTKQLFCVCNW